MIHSAAPTQFWTEALATVTYLVNRRPCRATGPTTPFELLFGVPAEYGELRVFGCLCYPNLSATVPHKLAPRSVACVFIGYPSDHRGYRCFDTVTRRVYTSRHVVFDEHTFLFRNAAPPSAPTAPATPVTCFYHSRRQLHVPAPLPHVLPLLSTPCRRCHTAMLPQHTLPRRCMRPRRPPRHHLVRPQQPSMARRAPNHKLHRARRNQNHARMGPP